MNYSRLTIKQQLTTARQQVATYEQEHYNLSLQDVLNGGPTDMGIADGEVFTSEDRRKKLEIGIELLNKEISRLEGLLPTPTTEVNTGQVDEENAAP